MPGNQKYGVSRNLNKVSHENIPREDFYIFESYQKSNASFVNRLTDHEKKIFFEELFCKVDGNIIQNKKIDSNNAIVAAIFTAVIGKKIYTSTLGNLISFACIYDKDGKLLKLQQLTTKTHQLEDLENHDGMERIIENEGKVIYTKVKYDKYGQWSYTINDKEYSGVDDDEYFKEQRITEPDGSLVFCADRVNANSSITRALGGTNSCYLDQNQQKLLIPIPQVDLYDIDELLNSNIGAEKIQIINVSYGCADSFIDPYLAINDLCKRLSAIGAVDDQAIATILTDEASRVSRYDGTNVTTLVKTVYDKSDKNNLLKSDDILLFGIFRENSTDPYGKVAKYAARQMGYEFRKHINFYIREQHIFVNDEHAQGIVIKRKFSYDDYFRLRAICTNYLCSSSDVPELLMVLFQLVSQGKLIEIRQFFKYGWSQIQDENFYCQKNNVKDLLREIAIYTVQNSDDYLYLLMPSLLTEYKFTISNGPLAKRPLHELFVTKNRKYIASIEDTMLTYEMTGKLINVHTSEKLTNKEIKLIKKSDEKRFLAAQQKHYDKIVNNLLPAQMFYAIKDLCENTVTEIGLGQELDEFSSEQMRRGLAYHKFDMYIKWLTDADREQFYDTKISAHSDIITMKEYLDLVYTDQHCVSGLAIHVLAPFLFEHDRNIIFQNPILKREVDQSRDNWLSTNYSIDKKLGFGSKVKSMEEAKKDYDDFCKYFASGPPISNGLNTSFIKCLLSQFNNQAIGYKPVKGDYQIGGQVYSNIPKGLANILKDYIGAGISRDGEIFKKLQEYSKSLVDKQTQKNKPYTANNIKRHYCFFRTQVTRRVYATMLNATDPDNFLKLITAEGSKKRLVPS